MSIKSFLINGLEHHYDYNALDNKPVIPSGAVVDATFSKTSTNAVQNKVITARLDTMDDAIEAASQSGGGMTEDVKQALLQLAQKVAYIDVGGTNYYQDLYDALYPSAVLTSITANFNQGSTTIYTTDTLDSLKPMLVVTAQYDDETTRTVTDYTLSGSLTAGTSVITASYGGKTDTFNVTVTRVAGTFSVSNNLTGCTNSNSTSTVAENAAYNATITANTGYTLTGATVSITMGGSSVTGYYSNGTISIPNVTGDVVITVVATAVTLSSISAVFSQGSNVIYDTDSLNTLKQYLVVTATYSDSSTATVPSADYTLSGTLAEGTSTVTVSYENKTTTFNVTVSASPKSDMNGWVDGIKYTDLEVVANSYVKKADGSIAAYNGWDRTGYVPCDGVEYLIIPPNSAIGADAQSNCFYNSEKQWLSSFSTAKSATTPANSTDINVVSVPSDAHYFIISNGSAILATIVNGGIIPNDDSRPRWTSGVPYSPSVYAPSESGKYITQTSTSMVGNAEDYTRSFIVDCEGASTLTISAELGDDLKYCHFYSDDLTPLGNFLTNKQSETIISIPSGTKFFCMSALTTTMDEIFNGTITVTPA